MSGLIKYRVHEVAKDFNMTSKEITQILTDYATTPKNHMQVLEDDELNDIFEYLTQHHQVASLEELYKVPDQPKAKPQATPAAQGNAPKAGAAPAKQPQQASQPQQPPKPKKDDKKKDDKKSTPKDDKKTDKKADKPSKGDPVAAAMNQARREATSRVESGDKGSSVEQALAQARRNAGGDGGGGGGEGDGPGGGLNDVYMGQVMLAGRPNWSFTSATRLNLVCVVRVKVNLQGEVEKVDVTQSSGNAQYDSSAANAIWRTSRAGAFPPPPSEQHTELDLVFTLNELMGR